jgi:hypothetical protein
MRVNAAGVWLLEIAARSIGGLCGRMLRHALGMSLEELILRQALDLPLPEATPGEASGVMMIPIPQHGMLHGVRGLEQALAVAGIGGIEITASPGQLIAPPPDGASYLGFIFAQGGSPEAVESSLRSAHARLAFDIQAAVSVDAPRA